MTKFQLFLENACLLQKEYGITPLLYGSVGLERLTGEDIGADDIDILIPCELVFKRFAALKALLEGNGYVLVDEREHTFVRDGVRYSYASIEELEAFAGIRIEDIKTYTDNDAAFLLLSLEQYLKVYERSVKDGYRINVRHKKDTEKIKMIKSKMNKFSRQRLYELLTAVPRGKVITYGQLAQRLGNKKWARAVGNALNKNPDGEKYPCYRVVNGKGELSKAYAFGGIEAQKRRLENDGITVTDHKVDIKKYGVR